jgi:hypothetical protein
VQLTLLQLPNSLDRRKPSMQEKFGSKISAGNTHAGDDERDQEIVKNHGKHPRVMGQMGSFLSDLRCNSTAMFRLEQ